ncbi:MAG: hypothetical protein WAX89_06690 [Alphaproteobacteria bacterium]
MEPIIYDSLDWHMKGDIAKDIKPEQVAVYIGFYLRWLFENDFLSDDILAKNEVDWVALDEGATTGGKLLQKFGGQITSNMLNVDGILFTNLYYLNGCFYANLEQALAEMEGVQKDDAHAMYRIPESEANYQIIKARIDFYMQETMRFTLRFLLNTVESNDEE